MYKFEMHITVEGEVYKCAHCEVKRAYEPLCVERVDIDETCWKVNRWAYPKGWTRIEFFNGTIYRTIWVCEACQSKVHVETDTLYSYPSSF